MSLKNGSCDCCGDPGGCPGCAMVVCCPCVAYYQAAEDIGDDNGLVYMIGTLLGFGCCMLSVLGDKVATKRGIEMGVPKAACNACCDCCTCFSCAVVNEAKLIKAEGGSSAPAAVEMGSRK